MKGNRAINNDNPMRHIVDAQLAAYLAAGGAITPIPVGQGVTTPEPLTAAQNREAIKRDTGKFFTGSDFTEDRASMRKARSRGGKC
jgi:hypothetical protein